MQDKNRSVHVSIIRTIIFIACQFVKSTLLWCLIIIYHILTYTGCVSELYTLYVKRQTIIQYEEYVFIRVWC